MSGVDSNTGTFLFSAAVGLMATERQQEFFVFTKESSSALICCHSLSGSAPSAVVVQLVDGEVKRAKFSDMKTLPIHEWSSSTNAI